MDIEEKTCKNCEEKFIPKNTIQMFCCRECSQDFYRERNKLPVHLREYYQHRCNYCDDYFTSYYSKELYCSANCRQKMKNDQANRQWAEREVKERPRSTFDGEWHRVSKKYTFFNKKFSACRG